MNKPIKQQMYIITAPCWKCQDIMNVAVIVGDVRIRKGFYGPEAFSQEEKKIAENNGVVIKEQHSYTRVETYSANTCPNCNTFIGKFYLFTEYFEPAEFGEYKYIIIDLI